MECSKYGMADRFPVGGNQTPMEPGGLGPVTSMDTPNQFSHRRGSLIDSVSQAVSRVVTAGPRTALSNRASDDLPEP